MKNALSFVLWLIMSSHAFSLESPDLPVSGYRPSLAYDANFFIESNLEFTLLHELAHAVIDLNNIPVLGGHERAADQIAIMLMIMTSEGFNEALFDKMLSISGEWMIEWRQEIQQHPLVFWDVHPLAIQRFYDVTCLVYGAAPDALEKIRKRTWLPIERAWECDKEYAKNREALQWLARNYSYAEFDSSWNLTSSGLRQSRGEVVQIEYIQPTNERHEAVKSWLEASQRLRVLIQRTNEILKLPKPVTIYFESQCGSPDAWWNPAINGIVICYSLMDQFELNAQSLKPLVDQLNQEAEQAFLFLFPEKYSGLISRDKNQLSERFIEQMDRILKTRELSD